MKFACVIELANVYVKLILNFTQNAQYFFLGGGIFFNFDI